MRKQIVSSYRCENGIVYYNYTSFGMDKIIKIYTGDGNSIDFDDLEQINIIFENTKNKNLVQDQTYWTEVSIYTTFDQIITINNKKYLITRLYPLELHDMQINQFSVQQLKNIKIDYEEVLK